MGAQRLNATAERGAVAPWRLHLLEPPDSPAFERIAGGAAVAGLAVQPVSRLDELRSNVQLVGVGPGVSDPLAVARHLRRMDSHAMLLFLVASSSQRATLQAELIRDPFLYARWELLELPPTTQQLASRIHILLTNLRRGVHATPTVGRGRRRPSHGSPRQNQLAHHNEQHLANILAQSQDAILSTDHQLRIQSWNASCERFFSRSAHDAIGERLDVVDARCEGEPLMATAQRVLDEGEAADVHATCHSGQGQALSLAISLVPVRDPQGVVRGLSILARDESVYRRVEDALRLANRQKDEFLAIMSHELRTPLTSILGYTDMLLRGLSGPLPPVSSKYLGNVRSAGGRLLDLVNSLLDYTRLEAGAETVEKRPVDLARLVGMVVAQYRVQAEQKQQELKLTVSKGIPARILGDEEKLIHVVKALLNNAIKFTPESGAIRVLVEPDSATPEQVRVSVNDTGIGMSPDVLPHVWDRFYQGDATLTRPYGGMGLGLSIARHLVALHGGSIQASSPGPGSGSTFSFSLPGSRSG